MHFNDNIIITQTGDKVGFKIKDCQKEILKTQKAIKRLTKEYDEILLDFRKVKESFCNKFGVTKSGEDITIDSEEFQTMRELAEEKEDFCAMIKWETTYLEGLQQNIKT